MKLRFGLALAALMILAAPARSAEPQKFSIELDASDVPLLGQALNELPKRLADPLIAKLNAQLQAQVAKAQEAAKPSEPVPLPTPDPRK